MIVFIDTNLILDVMRKTLIFMKNQMQFLNVVIRGTIFIFQQPLVLIFITL